MYFIEDTVTRTVLNENKHDIVIQRSIIIEKNKYINLAKNISIENHNNVNW